MHKPVKRVKLQCYFLLACPSSSPRLSAETDKRRPPSATAFHPDTQSTTNHFILTPSKRGKALCPPRKSPFRNTRMQCPRQTLAWFANNTCVAREQHLYGSRATLARLTSNTSVEQAGNPHIHKTLITKRIVNP